MYESIVKSALMGHNNYGPLAQLLLVSLYNVLQLPFFVHILSSVFFSPTYMFLFHASVSLYCNVHV